MTRDQWFQNPANIVALRKLIDEPGFQLAQKVLLVENRRRIRSLSSNPERNLNTDAAQFNEQAGFNRFLEELEMLATVPNAQEAAGKPDYKQPAPFDALAQDAELIAKERELYQQENTQ